MVLGQVISIGKRLNLKPYQNYVLKITQNINWCSHYGEQYGGSLKKPKLSYDMNQQSYSWVCYPEKIKTLIQKDMYTPMFISSTIYNNRDT